MEAIVQPGEVRVQRALLSVSDKTGVVEFARQASRSFLALALGDVTPGESRYSPPVT